MAVEWTEGSALLISHSISQQAIENEFAKRLGVKAGCVPVEVDWSGVRTVAPLVFAVADADVEIFDFTKGYDPNRVLRSPFGVGRYDEDRKGMYQADFFADQANGERRTIHVGVDLAAAAGTPVFAPFAGEIFGADIREQNGDYGGTLILCSNVLCGRGGTDANPRLLYSLLGHLSHASAKRWSKGDRVEAGELLGWLGAENENGGWNPHLHFQLSWLEPLAIDLPGAVAPSMRDLARLVFPNPCGLLKSALAGWSGGRSN